MLKSRHLKQHCSENRLQRCGRTDLLMVGCGIKKEEMNMSGKFGYRKIKLAVVRLNRKLSSVVEYMGHM